MNTAPIEGPTIDTRAAAAMAMADGVAATLRMARAMATAGRGIDLNGLDQMVGQLCARCLDVPPEEGRALRPVLAALLADLDALGASIAPT